MASAASFVYLGYEMDMKKIPRRLRPIWMDDDLENIKVIDQRLLPHEYKVLNLKTVDDIIMAIKEMVVRGAPLIGVTAAYGVYLAVLNSPGKRADGEYLERECSRLKKARPTAVNLVWAVDRILFKFVPNFLFS